MQKLTFIITDLNAEAYSYQINCNFKPNYFLILKKQFIITIVSLIIANTFLMN